jgi:hypothetical protein
MKCRDLSYTLRQHPKRRNMIEQFPPDPYDDAPAPQSAPTVPHSREAEESAIGCVLINPDAYFEVADLINSNDFYIQRHKWIWDSFVNLSMNRMAIDIMTVSDELDRAGKLQEVGDSAYLTMLIGQVSNSLNIASYARIIEAYSVRRKMIEKANKIATLAYDNSKPVEDMLHEYDRLVAPDQLGTSSIDDTQDSDEASLELLEKIQSTSHCLIVLMHLLDSLLARLSCWEIVHLASQLLDFNFANRTPLLEKQLCTLGLNPPMPKWLSGGLVVQVELPKPPRKCVQPASHRRKKRHWSIPLQMTIRASMVVV